MTRYACAHRGLVLPENCSGTSMRRGARKRTGPATRSGKCRPECKRPRCRPELPTLVRAPKSIKKARCGTGKGQRGSSGVGVVSDSTGHDRQLGLGRLGGIPWADVVSAISNDFDRCNHLFRFRLKDPRKTRDRGSGKSRGKARHFLQLLWITRHQDSRMKINYISKRSLTDRRLTEWIDRVSDPAFRR